MFLRQSSTGLAVGLFAVRTLRRNICESTPGVRAGVHPSSPKEAFLLFFEEIIDEAVRYSNLETRRVVSIILQSSVQTTDKTNLEKVTLEETVELQRFLRIIMPFE